MNLYALATLISSICTACWGLHVKSIDCGSTGGKVSYVDINPCTNPSQCILKKGTKPTVTVEFNTNRSISDVRVVITGHLAGGIHKQFEEFDACKGYGLTCPLAAGGPYKFVNSIPIKEYYPDFKVIVQYEFQDEKGADAICFEVNTKIGSETREEMKEKKTNETKQDDDV